MMPLRKSDQPANSETLECSLSFGKYEVPQLATPPRSALAAHWKLDTRLTEENLANPSAQPVE